MQIYITVQVQRILFDLFYVAERNVCVFKTATLNEICIFIQVKSNETTK